MTIKFPIEITTAILKASEAVLERRVTVVKCTPDGRGAGTWPRASYWRASRRAATDGRAGDGRGYIVSSIWQTAGGV